MSLFLVNGEPLPCVSMMLIHAYRFCVLANEKHAGCVLRKVMFDDEEAKFLSDPVNINRRFSSTEHLADIFGPVSGRSGTNHSSSRCRFRRSSTRFLKESISAGCGSPRACRPEVDRWGSSSP